MLSSSLQSCVTNLTWARLRAVNCPEENRESDVRYVTTQQFDDHLSRFKLFTVSIYFMEQNLILGQRFMGSEAEPLNHPVEPRTCYTASLLLPSIPRAAPLFQCACVSVTPS